MKVTIEYEDQAEAMQAMKSVYWQNAMWQLDQELRSIVKHGYMGNKEITSEEMDVFQKCRDSLHEAMNDNNVTFD